MWAKIVSPIFRTRDQWKNVGSFLRVLRDWSVPTCGLIIIITFPVSLHALGLMLIILALNCLIRLELNIVLPDEKYSCESQLVMFLFTL